MFLGCMHGHHSKLYTVNKTKIYNKIWMHGSKQDNKIVKGVLRESPIFRHREDFLRLHSFKIFSRNLKILLL